MDTAKYDWMESNKTIVRQMRASLAAQYRVENGLSKGRSMIAASDYIALNLMRPPKSGQELDAWLNATHSGPLVERLKGYNRFKPTTDYHVEIVEGLTPPVLSSARGGDDLWKEAWDIVRDLPIETWRSIKLQDTTAAIRCQTSVNTYAKQTLHSAENGWKLRTKIDKQHDGILWMIKIKTQT